MKIKTIKNVKEGYEIPLSTDNMKNINIIFGQNAVGKTRLFDKIKSCLTSRQCSDVDLELIDADDHYTNLVFVDEEEIMRSPCLIIEDLNHVLSLEHVSDQKIQEVMDEMNHIIDNELESHIYGYKFKIANRRLVYEDHAILYAGANERNLFHFLVYLFYRKIIEYDVSVIMDGVLIHMKNETRRDIIKICGIHIPQSIIFLTDLELFHGCDEEPTLYEYLKKQSKLGYVYKLTKEGISRYDKQ